MQIILGLILGGLFGAALYYVGASNPKRLLSMLRLQDLTLMKIILLGIGFGSVLLSVTALLGGFDNSHLSIKSTHLGVIIGGLIFGIGFGSIGTCPGTCVAAGSSGGGKKAISTILGGLLGAFTFSITYGYFKGIGLFDTMDLGKLTLFSISDQYPAVLPIGFVGLLVVGVLFMVIGTVIPNKGFNN